MIENLQKGEIITFYSYKGGTGRSMSLANVACVLARQQPTDKGVLMIDWDLEAPGLHRFFQNSIGKLVIEPDAPLVDIDKKTGLIDLFWAFNNLTPTSEPKDYEEAEMRALQCIEAVRLEDYILPIDIPNLNLLKAGCFDPNYSTRVNTFNWEGLFHRSPLLIRNFAERLSERYRYILIDSRTGITDISGICTTLMPEKLVVVFTPNRQSLTGLNDLSRRATKYRRESDDLRPLLIFPLASRIETSEPVRKDKWRFGDEAKGIEGYQPLFEKLFKEVYDLKECDLSTYFDEVMIQHMPPYAYGEEIATLIERGQDALSLTRSYLIFTDRLTQTDAPWASHAVPSVAEYVTAKEKEKKAIIAAELHLSMAERATRRAKKIGVMAIVTVVLLIIIGVLFGTWYRQSATKTELELAQNSNNLASLYEGQGKYEQAIRLYQQSLEIQEKVLGKDHPNVAITMNNLAALYAKSGRYTDAEPLYKRALEIRVKALGSDHPDVADSLNNLASMYRDEGRYREAEPLYKRALVIYEKSSGGDRTRSAEVLRNYKELLQKMKVNKGT